MKLKGLVLASVIGFVAVSCGKKDNSSSPAADPNAPIEGVWSNKATYLDGSSDLDVFSISSDKILECDVHTSSTGVSTKYALNSISPYSFQNNTITILGFSDVFATYDPSGNTISYNGNIYSPLARTSADFTTINAAGCGF